MAKAKCKPKPRHRGSTLKIKKRTRKAFKKQTREERRQERALARIPHTVLLLDSEREQLERIKEATKARTEAAKQLPATPEEPAHLARLKRALEAAAGDPATVFVEVVDYRDIHSGRARDCEEAVAAAKVPLYIYLSHYDAAIPVDFASLEEAGRTVLREMAVFANAQNVYVFGQPKCGKYTLATEITAINPNAVITRITTPPYAPFLSALLRGAVADDKIDALVQFQQLWNGLDRAALADFYRIRPADTPEECLDELGARITGEQRPRRRREVAASQFFADARTGRIPWARLPSGFVFDFAQRT